jgi:hypothetical protein
MRATQNVFAMAFPCVALASLYAGTDSAVA